MDSSLIQTLFENDQWIAVAKPHGWLTVPAREADDPRPCLGTALQRQVGRQIYPVHRLDFEVGGVVLFAKSPEAHRVSQGWFESGEVQKIYEGWSRPAAKKMSAEVEEWRSRLAKGKKRAFQAPHGKNAVTRARVVEQFDDKWIWNLEPVTGRSHQLRFEMFHRGHPLLGDVLYGGEALDRLNFIALRAVELNFSSIQETKRLGLPDLIRTSSLA